jgi:hypothetical protein
MRLKSFGCSFIFGSELADSSMSPENVRSSDHTWPAHLARYLGRDYKCYAKPGSGNLQILEKLLIQAANTNGHDLFVIGWSWIDRFDYYNSDYNVIDSEYDYDEIVWQDWLTIMPVDTDDVAKTYYRNLHAEYRDKFTCLSYIKLAIDTLNQKGIPFIMTYMDKLLFDQRWHITPAVLDLQEYVKPYMTTFEGQSFLEWSRVHGYPETEAWHPLEEAHRAASEYVIKLQEKQQ